MARHSITRKKYLDTAQIFHWAKRKDFEHWFHGEELEKMGKRDRRTESLLNECEKNRKLRVARYEGRKIYSARRRLKGLKDEEINPELFPHGVACTDCLVRFRRSDMDEKTKIISEKEFHGFGRKPEWGMLFPVGTLMLLEFCTENNFKRKKVLNNKVTTYIKILPNILDKFGAREGIVLFVCDVTRDKVFDYVGSLGGRTAPSPTAISSASDEGDRFPLDPFLFVDYETFKQVPLGYQLTEKIYIWAVDGTEHALR